jgi:threonine/homoserine/homoserine lactone efflux protein
VLAHIGHWSTSLMYLGPVVLLVGYLGVQTWRDRRRSKEDDGK